MSVIYEIGNEESLLKIIKRDDGLHVIGGVKTICWGYLGKSTLDENLVEEKKNISKMIETLNKTNQSSKKGLKFLLNELETQPQLTLNL